MPDTLLGTGDTAVSQSNAILKSDSLLTMGPDSPNSVLARSATTAFQKNSILFHYPSAETATEYGTVEGWGKTGLN